MAETYAKYPGNGSTKTFTVTFPFIDRNHVVVTVNDIVQLTPSDFRWLNDSSIQFTNAPGSNSLVTIRRATPRSTALVDYQNGAVLTQDQLNLAFQQNFYLNQESYDQFSDLLLAGYTRIGDGTAVTATEAVDAAVQDVLNSAALATLNTAIDDIDLNGETLLDQQGQITTLQSTIDGLLDIDGTGVTTFILNEQTARINGDDAINQVISLMGAVSGDSLSFIVDLDTTKVSPTESLGTRLSGLQSSIDTNAAAVVTEQSARVTADSAIASDVTTLQATVGDNTASIETAATALSTLDDQVQATYTLKVDVNGNVAGFIVQNDGTDSDFIVKANRFAVVNGSGNNQVSPFIVDNGIVYMDTAYIKELTVDKLTAGNLVQDINPTDGKIVMDTGTHVKVIGNGFGTALNLIEWFGTKANHTAGMTTANSLSHVTTDGDAYFGGTLSSGVLSNSTVATSVTASSEAILGPYGSNGDTINTVWSYFASDSYFTGTDLDGDSVSVTVRLYRTREGNAEVLKSTKTYTATISAEWDAEQGEYWTTYSLSGSATYTDPALTTDDRTYRMDISSRTLPASGGNPTTQRLSIHSTEE